MTTIRPARTNRKVYRDATFTFLVLLPGVAWEVEEVREEKTRGGGLRFVYAIKTPCVPGFARTVRPEYFLRPA